MSVRLISTLLFISIFLNVYPSSPEYMRLVEKSDSLIEKENWVEAEITLLTALRTEPANFSNALLLSNLGIVRNNLQKYDAALEAFSLGLSLSPSSTVIHNNRALTFLHLNDFDKALEDLSESLQTDSIQEWPLQMKGLLLLQKGDVLNAKENFLQLLKHYPQQPVALSSLGTISEIEGDNNMAFEYYNQALKIRDDVETHSSRILLKIRMDKFSEAKEEINECLAQNPEEPIYYVLRGYLHRLNYRNEEAQADRKLALAKGADLQLVDFYIPDQRR